MQPGRFEIVVPWRLSKSVIREIGHLCYHAARCIVPQIFDKNRHNVYFVQTCDSSYSLSLYPDSCPNALLSVRDPLDRLGHSDLQSFSILAIVTVIGAGRLELGLAGWRKLVEEKPVAFRGTPPSPKRRRRRLHPGATAAFYAPE